MSKQAAMVNLTNIEIRDDVGLWLNESGLLGEAVEVGALNGANARHIISKWQGQRLHLVDPWGTHIPEQYRERNDWTDFAACKRECQQLAEEYNPRVNLIQKKSLDAVGLFGDDFLEFIYIDAAHDFHSVIADAVGWWPKLKRGGLLGFHDANYNDTVWPAYNEVKRALESWCPFMGLAPHITSLCGSAWLIKP